MKLSTLILLIHLVLATPTDVSRVIIEAGRDLQSLENCFITFVDCERPGRQPEASTISFECNYEIEPGDGTYKTEIFSSNENGDCLIEDRIPPPPFIRVESPTGTGVDGEFTPEIVFDKALLVEAIQNNPGVFSFEFCIRNTVVVTDLDGNEVEVAPHLTKVQVGLSFDGAFGTDADGAPTTEIIVDSTVSYSGYTVATEYTVSSYICSADPPHDPLDESTTYSADEILSVCIITNEGETILQSLQDYELIQYDDEGNVINNFVYVKDGAVSGIAFYDCTKVKPDSDIEGSMCFVQTKITLPFYLNPDFGIVAVGNTDLQLNKELASRARELLGQDVIQEKKGPVSIDGSMQLEVTLKDTFDPFASSQSSILQIRTSLLAGLVTGLAGFLL